MILRVGRNDVCETGRLCLVCTIIYVYVRVANNVIGRKVGYGALRLHVGSYDCVRGLMIVCWVL